MDTTNSILTQGFADVVNRLAEKPLAAPVNPVPAGNVPRHGTLGHHALRPKTAAYRVRQHLEIYPEDAELSVRDLAKKLNVGKSSVSRVMQTIREEV